MKPKILFLDLDGTLLNDRSEVSPGNRRAMEQALRAGHRIVVTSGRPTKSSLLLARRLGLAGPGCYVISCNGGIITDCGSGRELVHHTLPLEDLYRIFDEANRRGVYIQTYDHDDVVIEEHSGEAIARRYCALSGLEYRVMGAVRTGLTEAPAKALMIRFEDRGPLEAMQQWVLRHMSNRIDCFFSSVAYLEVVPAGICKGRALEELCRRLNLPLEDSIAVGDEANDISMIRTAGTGIAMRNARPEVKAAADCITRLDNNHDAIAEVIGTFML